MINPEKIAAKLAEYVTYYRESLAKVQAGIYAPMVMEVPSTGSENDYSFLRELASVQEWLGPVAFEQLVAEAFVIKNKDWVQPVKVHRNEIADDKDAMVQTRIDDAAPSFERHQIKLYASLLNDGGTNTGFDGVAFYSASHPRRPGLANQSNHLGQVLSDTNFNTAYAAVMNLTDYHGERLGLVPTVLEVGPALRATGAAVVKASLGSGGGTNVNFGACELRVNPWITSGTAWFLHCTDRPMRPFIKQMRQEPMVEDPKRNAGDPWWLIEANARYNMGYGHYALSYRGNS